MTDFSLPTTARHYDDEILSDIMNRDVSIVERLFASDTNIPIGTLKFEPWSAATHSGRRVWEYQETGWVVIAHADAPGTIEMLGTATIPAGWLLCNGDAISQTTYADLFAEIGTTFGVGGAGTFKVPDMRQRFPLGKAASGTGSTLGINGVGGTINHQHTGSTHAHTLNHYHTSQRHYHSASGAGASLSAAGQTLSSTSSKIYGSLSTDSTHAHGLTTWDHAHGQTVTSRQTGGGPGLRDDYDSDSPGGSIGYDQGVPTESAVVVNFGFTVTGSEHTHGAGTLLIDISHIHDANSVLGIAGSSSDGSVNSDSSDRATSGIATGETVAIDGSGYGTTPLGPPYVNPPFLPLNFIIRT